MKYTIHIISLRDHPAFTHAFDNSRDAAEYIAENCIDDYYDEMLNECYPTVNICGYDYDPAHALYLCDPTAYQCGRNDWADSITSDLADELDGMDDGDELELYGFAVTAEEA